MVSGSKSVKSVNDQHLVQDQLLDLALALRLAHHLDLIVGTAGEDDILPQPLDHAPR